MILLSAASRGERATDALSAFASRLARRGFSAVIDAGAVEMPLLRTQKYEIAPYLAETGDVAAAGTCLVLGAEAVSADAIVAIRDLAFDAPPRITAIGRFPDRQAAIGAEMTLAAAFGHAVGILDLAGRQPSPILEDCVLPLAGLELGPGPERVCRVSLLIPAEEIEEPGVLSVLGALDAMPGFRLQVITASRGREAIRASRFSGLESFAYGDLPAETFAAITDIAVVLGPTVPGERMAAMLMDLMVSGRIVVDATQKGSVVEAGAPALRGPDDLGTIAVWLRDTLLPNRAELGRQVRAARWSGLTRWDALEAALGLEAPARPVAARGTVEPRIVFLPTNGIGLGHAQRCTEIAGAMTAPARARTRFFAFPSCMSLVADRGFPFAPLVSKSDDHAEPFANDLVNHLRLERALAPGDTLVFDGGYVFDSIFRAIQEKPLRGIWIRRGLWQAGQANDTVLERERLFERVIVPQEAFDELNQAYGLGAAVDQVGPVVRRAHGGDAAVVRAALAERMGFEFDELVVTMLGSGLVADRSAQLALLANLVERRPGTAQAVVLWPGAPVSSALSGWRRTRAVQTLDALRLASAADLVISAAGYNAFHETLYNRLPTVFVPQMAPVMDDQERRARAASDRGLARTVLAHELLGLEQAVRTMLDGSGADELRRALEGAELPPVGTAAAAAIIAGEAPGP